LSIDLFHKGAIALSQVEANGLMVDKSYLEKAIIRVTKKIKRLEEELLDHKIYKKVWKKKFRNKAKLGSRSQLGTIFFDELGYERNKITTAKEKNGERAFEGIDESFLTTYFDCERLKKALSTNLKGIQREISLVDRIHPMFDLNMASTYRSSSQRPNIQNQPIRNLDISKIVRKCIIAPPGYRIGELDYGGIEVCVSACYHKDPTMVKYIEDPANDMHRDLAMQCYMLKKKEVGKLIRYTAKNMFVFPQFYGSYFVDCAKNMWEATTLLKLETESCVLLKNHLKSKGIKRLGDINPDPNTGRIITKTGTFLDHIREVEKDFWERRFRVYAQWKKDWWDQYLERGWIRLKTGFVCQGMLDRKQCCNWPIQGSAFHCLLWSMIQLQDWLNKKGMKTKIIAEIHDSMVIEFYIPEIDRVLRKAKQIMTEKIREHWKWISIPLTVEAEIAPEEKSWYEKESYEIK